MSFNVYHTHHLVHKANIIRDGYAIDLALSEEKLLCSLSTKVVAVYALSNDFSTALSKPVCELRGHSDGITCLAANGKMAVTSSWDMTGRLWDINEGKLVHLFRIYYYLLSIYLLLIAHECVVESCALSNDGKFIAFGGKSLNVFDMRKTNVPFFTSEESHAEEISAVFNKFHFYDFF